MTDAHIAPCSRLVRQLLRVACTAGREPGACRGLDSSTRDQPFAGEIHLDVDASDVDRRIVHVKETISGLAPDAVLLYPKWLPGAHAPEGPIDRLAGLTLTSGGKVVSWVRDTVNVYVFRPHLAAGTRTLELSFDYLSPTSGKVGTPQMTHELLILEWSDVLLYPAGRFARQIPVSASAKFPQDCLDNPIRSDRADPKIK